MQHEGTTNGDIVCHTPKLLQALCRSRAETADSASGAVSVGRNFFIGQC